MAKTTKKTMTKTTDAAKAKAAAARAKVTAQIVELRTKKKLSFRAIEQKLAKQLGLDPARPFGGFVAFNRFHGALKAAKAAAKPTKKAAVKKTVAKKVAAVVATKTAPNGARVVA